MNIYSMNNVLDYVICDNFKIVVINKNVIGMQFHPEKVKKWTKIIKNFLNLMPVKEKIIPLLTVIVIF